MELDGFLQQALQFRRELELDSSSVALEHEQVRRPVQNTGQYLDDLARVQRERERVEIQMLHESDSGDMADRADQESSSADDAGESQYQARCFTLQLQNDEQKAAVAALTAECDRLRKQVHLSHTQEKKMKTLEVVNRELKMNVDRLLEESKHLPEYHVERCRNTADLERTKPLYECHLEMESDLAAQSIIRRSFDPFTAANNVDSSYNFQAKNVLWTPPEELKRLSPQMFEYLRYLGEVIKRQASDRDSKEKLISSLRSQLESVARHDKKKEAELRKMGVSLDEL